MELRAGGAAAAADKAARPGFGLLLRRGFGAHGLLLGLALACLLAFRFMALAAPVLLAPDRVGLALGLVTGALPTLLLGLAVYIAIDLAAVVRPKRPIPALLRRMKSILGDPVHLAAGLPVLLALALFLYVFTLVKAIVGVLTPFTWDVTLDRWDTALHFGFRPWQLLQPVLGWWPVTVLLNLNYNAWFVVLNVFWAYFAFVARPGVLRTRFFLSFIGIWAVGGGMLAMGLASAGPCYFSRLGLSPDPYAPLMAYLRDAATHAPVWALATQDMLWSLRQQGSGLGGISAMPSIHAATALLFVLSCPWNSAAVKRLLVAHVVLVFLGSILLGWHYAVDSYAAWGLAFIIWRAMGPVSRWWHETRATQDFHSALTAGL